MKKQYTINEIATILNLSRNTVSKVLNDKKGVSPKTQKIVWNFLASNQTVYAGDFPKMHTESQNRNVIFTYHLSNGEYLNNILNGLERYLKGNGYTLILNIVHDDEEGHISLPPALNSGLACGIISFNIFDKDYWEKIIDLHIPSVFIDTFYQSYLFAGRTDIITPENCHAIHKVIGMLLEKGKKRFGFIGNPYYCYSSNQRWLAFCSSLQNAGLEVQKEFCILEDLLKHSDSEQMEFLRRKIEGMPQCPEAFVCTSDSFATILSCVLQEKGYRIPQDVSIVGFDNLSETLRQSPTITTIDAHSEYLGEIAGQKLLERIANPKKYYEFLSYSTDLILRDST